MRLRRISIIRPLSLYIAVYSTFLLLIATFDRVIRRRIESATELPANMHCNLIDLSAELHLIIIEELLRYDLEGHDDNEERQDKRINVYHHLINWSSTSSYFRNLLEPNIFKTVKLVNGDKISASLITLANSPHNALVK